MLSVVHCSGNEDADRSPKQGECSWKGGVANLALTAIGAGILSLPHAYCSVGLLFGLVISILAALCTLKSTSIIATRCAKAKKESYGQLVGSIFGQGAESTLQGSIILHVFGVMIVYLVILADILVGPAGSKNGLIPFMLGSAGKSWMVSRWFVTLVSLVTVVAPMLMARNLTAVSRFSRASVYLLLYVAATLLLLAGVALFQGQSGIADVQMLPTWSTIGGYGGLLGFLSATLTVFSVTALAYTCQFNVVAVHNSLSDNRTVNMSKVLRVSVSLCGGLYICVATSGYVLFGSKTDGDVLNNLTVQFASGLLGQHLAAVVVGLALVAYSLSLQVNFILKVWAVRQALCEATLGVDANSLRTLPYHLTSFSLVSLAFCISIFVPSVWFMVSLVGSTACATFSYVFPGMILIRQPWTKQDKVIGIGAIWLASVLAITGILNTLNGHSG